MKQRNCKLVGHNRSSQKDKDDDLIINSRDFPEWKEGDIVDIYTPEDDGYHLLLQVSDREEKMVANTISVEQTILQLFQIRPYSMVSVSRVEDLADVPKLDLVEILLKDQYFGRSEMWRFGESLRRRIVYCGKRIEFSCMRVTIHQMWYKGEQLDSGYVDESTRFVFRSQSAVFDIFIQASSEMWEFDPFGDCYFEKAIDGFVRQLFEKWRERECTHDYTIVVFSRVYYDAAQSLDDFPHSSRSCIMHETVTNRFYEDFYDVIVQNERFVPNENNYLNVLTKLRRLFNNQEVALRHFHSSQSSRFLTNMSTPSPQSSQMSTNAAGSSGSLRRSGPFAHARISTASQGNILETLNLTISHKYKFNADRNFDRTGRVSVIVSPGQGVFEVNRQLSSFTGQCTIDLGIAIDLVCLGEQPLHAVPLFKYTRALRSPLAPSCLSARAVAESDDYSIPTWINLSFYRSENSYRTAHFVPQIKINLPHSAAHRGCPKCTLNQAAGSKAGANVHVRQSSKTQLLTSGSIRSGESLALALNANSNVNVSALPNKPGIERQCSHAPDSALMNTISVPNFGMRQSYYDDHDRRVFSRANMRHPGASRRTPHYRRARYLSNVYDNASRRKSMPVSDMQSNVGGKGKAHRNGLSNARGGQLEEHAEYDDQLSEEQSDSNRLDESESECTHGATNLFDELALERRRERAKSLDDLPLSVATACTDFDETSEEARSRSKVSLYSGTPASTGALDAEEHPLASDLAANNQQTSSKPIAISNGNGSNTSVTSERNVVGSAGSPPPPLGNGFAVLHSSAYQNAPLRALVNPFQPSRISSIRTTWHRRRWSHVFPLDKDGLTLQPHHKTTVSSPDETRFAEQQLMLGASRKPHVQSVSAAAYEQQRAALAGGEPDWSPGVTTYVDWRSLVLPASLPITTDYLPDEHTLNTQYSRNEYTLEPALIIEEFTSTRRKPTVAEVFRELVSTRLAQGFQIVSTSLQFPQHPPGTGPQLQPLTVGVGTSCAQLAVSPPLSSGPGALPHAHVSVSAIRSSQKPLMATQKPSSNANIVSSQVLKSTDVRKTATDVGQVSKGGKENKMTSSKVYSTSPALGGVNMKPHNTLNASECSTVNVSGLKPEYKVSYGRFFHQLELDASTSRIHVSMYRPKHTFQQQLHDYTFRFRVPHSPTYESNRFRFATEQVELTNWNQVDYYVCTRGEDEQTYPLQDSFRCWRTRTILMPLWHQRRPPLNASVVAADQAVSRCDVHADKTIDEQLALTESFVKLVEAMNRCSRLKQTSNAPNALASTTSASAAPGAPAAASGAAAQPVRKVQLPATGLKRFATSGNVSSADGSLATNSNFNVSGASTANLNPILEVQAQRSPAGTSKDETSNIIAVDNPSDESLQLLRSAMIEELRFVTSQMGLQFPANCFVSHDAVLWLKNNVEFPGNGEVDALEQACTIMQHMLARGMVQRATNFDDAAARRLFVFGYYLYAFTQQDEQSGGTSRVAAAQPGAAAPLGPRRIIEVEFVIENRRMNAARTRFDTACERGDSDEDEHMRNVTIDLDRDQHKIDRVEWLNLRYSRFYSPLCAFQLDLRWLVASGSVLGELISLWCNRAVQNSLYLMLVPVHLFANDEERSRTDPLSCPIFLPLNMKVIAGAVLDSDPPLLLGDLQLDESHWQCVRTLQTYVLRRCGFLPVGCEPTRERYGAAACLHFVHCTGCASVSISGSQEQGLAKTGYFWFWNHMSVRRVHSQTTVDEQFKESLVSDFKALCDGEDGRLLAHCRAALKRNATDDDSISVSSSGIHMPALTSSDQKSQHAD